MVSRSESDIVLEMLRDSEDVSLIDASNLIEQVRNGNATENQYVLILSTKAKQFSIFESDNDTNRNNTNINTAVGEALDNFGKIVHVPRIKASPSIVTLNISLTSQSNAISIPQGTPVILQNIYQGKGYEYVTSEDVTIPAGTTEISIQAENRNPCYVTPIPIGAVTGLSGFSTITVTNNEESTAGNNIEEDNAYRERIPNWAAKNERCSKEYITAYLDSYTGVDDYKLIQGYNGAGTLQIVCDAPQNLFNTIRDDVHSNCMLSNDIKPDVVPPTTKNIPSLVVVGTIGDARNNTEQQIGTLLLNLTKAFVRGGQKRDGTNIRGLRIGESFVPGKLIRFLLEEIPEISNVYLLSVAGSTEVITDIITADDTEKIDCNSISTTVN